jgi:hypothetical protein
VTQVTHIVLVSWKPGQAEEAEKTIGPAIRGFASSIPGVVHVVAGHSTSPEGKEDGYDYGFVITFESAAARDAYLPDPRHRVVGDAIGSAAERVLVFDV